MENMIANPTAEEQHQDSFFATLRGLVAGAIASVSEDEPIFQTDADPMDLWDMYLENIKAAKGEAERHHLDCRTCKEFFRKYAGLVTVNDDNSLKPAMWSFASDDETATITTDSIAIFRGAKITHQWFSETTRIGVESNVSNKGVTWTHFFGDVKLAHTSKNPTAASAKTTQRVNQVYDRSTGILRYSQKVYDEAKHLFLDGQLDRAPQFLAMVQFHATLSKDIRDKTINRNGVWRRIALAPEGWENSNSTMVGQLYNLISVGTTLQAIQRFWNPKVDGANFQRPQAAPDPQTIQQAERLIAELGLAKSLERRYATLSDLRLIWAPQEKQVVPNETKGVFSSLLEKVNQTDEHQYETRQTMTWEKFSETLLPQATEIELALPTRGNYGALVTAVHADAPPILSYDNPDDRYPISSFVFVNGSAPTQWRLGRTLFVRVQGITQIPGFEKRYALVLEGAVCAQEVPSALFPELLISELHGVRSVIEAYSTNTPMSLPENDPPACGYIFGEGDRNMTIRVIVDGRTKIVTIDRMV